MKSNKKIKLTVLFLLLTAFVFALVGCSKKADNQSQEEKKAISFVDDDGVSINLDKPAERIISLYSAHTENIYYLGAEDKLIGGYKTCVYPPKAAFLDMYDYNGDPEKIIVANPDLVIIRPFVRKKAPEYVSAIENAGITVVSLYPESFDDFDDYIRKLASLTGTSDKAEELLTDFYKQIKDIEDKTAQIKDKKTVFFEATETNIRTITPDSMAGLAIKYAGGENLAKDAVPMSEGSTIAEFGEEKVLINADNIDVYISQRGSMNSGANEIGIHQRDGFEAIKAIKEDKFFTINEKIVSSPTFRYVKGVKEIARFLYPEVMDNIDEYKSDDMATRRDFANLVVMQRHIPIYLPTSSSYYKTEQKGHTFGLFEDIDWQDKDFDYIETAVESGYVEWDKKDDKEYFNPDANVTRDELAKAVFVMGDFSAKDKEVQISDLADCDNQRIVEILVQNGVFDLNDGKFEPKRNVSKNEIIKAIEFVK